MSRWLHVLTPGSDLPVSRLAASTLASVRLRAAVAVQALAAQGWQLSAGDRIAPQATDVLIGKIGSSDIAQRAPFWLMQLQALHSAGAQLWLDYTDHHLGFDSPMQGFYRAVLPLVTTVVVPSEALQQQLEQVWKGAIAVVVDALDVPIRAPKPRRETARQTALWFGHASNVRYLLGFLLQNPGLADQLQVLALSNPPGIDILAAGYRSGPIALHCLPWSAQATVAAAGVADLALIPSDVNDARKSGVSANRLVTALALGLPVAADVLPAYAPHRRYFSDIRSEDLQALLRDDDARCQRVAEAQKTLVPRYMPAVVGREWLAMLSGFAPAQRTAIRM